MCYWGTPLKIFWTSTGGRGCWDTFAFHISFGHLYNPLKFIQLSSLYYWRYWRWEKLRNSPSPTDYAVNRANCSSSNISRGERRDQIGQHGFWPCPFECWHYSLILGYYVPKTVIWEHLERNSFQRWVSCIHYPQTLALNLSCWSRHLFTFILPMPPSTVLLHHDYLINIH